MATLTTILTQLDRRIPGKADRIEMVDAINVALQEIGKVTKIDATLTVTNDATTYSLPSGVRNVVRVEVARGTSSDTTYDKVGNWREVEGTIYLAKELPYTTGNTIRIYYNDTHDSVSDDTDTISDDVPIALICAIAAYRYEYTKFYNQANMGLKDQTILETLRAEMMLAKSAYRVKKMARDPIAARF